MRYLITTVLVATALALPLGGASAQGGGADLMARCNQAVGQMKFEGWPADRNREMMMSACLHNDGAIPGAQQEAPVALRHAPARRH